MPDYHGFMERAPNVLLLFGTLLVGIVLVGILRFGIIWLLFYFVRISRMA